MPQLGNKHYTYTKEGKKKFLADKIRMLKDEGKPQKVIAIALSLARKKKGKKVNYG